MLDRYYLKIIKDLAVFRYFYHLSREQALELPSWEWDALLDELPRIHAERDLQNVYAAASGFNGGDFSSGYINALQKTINQGFEIQPKKVKSLDDLMPGIDSLIPAMKRK